MKPETLHDITLETAAYRFAALGSEPRLSVLRSIVRAGPEGLAIGELGERTGIRGATLTHHVKILEQAGLIRRSRKGRSVICAAPSLSEIESLAHFLICQCAPQHGESALPPAGEEPDEQRMQRKHKDDKG